MTSPAKPSDAAVEILACSPVTRPAKVPRPGEQENAKLKRLAAELSLEKQLLKDVTRDL